jgi:hypothetical protein
VQPVSGPFAPYSRSRASGLTLRYFSAAGAPLTALSDAPRIARVEVSVHGAARESLAGTRVPLTDSQTVSAAVRNR